MKSGKRHMEAIELPNQEKIRTLRKKETYKYLGILEANTSKKVEMKEKIKKECLRKTRKLLEIKLYSKNLIKRINTWAVPLVRHSGLFLKRTWEELKQIDLKTRKPMNMYKALHNRDDVDRLYVLRKEGGRSLTSIEDSVDASILRLKYYIEKRRRLITSTGINTDNTRIDRTEITRKLKWEEKQHYGHFKRLTSEISHKKTWTRLRKWNLRKRLNLF